MQLLKYDFKGLLSLCLPAYALATLGGVWNLILGFAIEELGPKISGEMLLILELIYAVTNFFIYLLIVITAIWVVMDFYKTVFGKIGYLTHTLPVKTHEILNSKLISGTAMFLLSTLVTEILTIGLLWAKDPYTIEIWLHEDGFFSVFFALIFAFSCATILQFLSVTTAIALAHLTRYKIVLSIVFFLLLYHMVGNIPLIAVLVFMFTASMDVLLGGIDTIVHAAMVYGGVSLLLSPILYFITLNIMKKKLNLE